MLFAQARGGDILLFDDLEHPIVLAPMAGGPSTVSLAVAVSEAGGLGFLASGYRRADDTAAEIAAFRAQTERPFGVNVFVPGHDEVDKVSVAAYLERLGPEARRYEAALGEARNDLDDWSAKLDLLRLSRPAVTSFTFGCPPRSLIQELRHLGMEIWVTVTTAHEAQAAQAAGASALIAQGLEAGGHRGGFSDPGTGDGFGLLTLIRLISAVSDLPIVATGGIADGAALAGVLAAGASAGQLGTAFLLAPEAGTHPAHRKALRAGKATALTRAFSGRLGRGIENRFLRAHACEAPSAYPHIHHATSPLRAAARARGDADGFNLWAGQAHDLARELPARAIVRAIGDEARTIRAVEAHS
jgi:nitronate monooxygenase